MKKIIYVSFLPILIFISSCTTDNVAEQADVVIDPTNVVSQDGDWFDQQTQMVLSSNSGSLDYDINVPSAGRYKIEVVVAGEGQLWIEDYRDNKDGRTYNITGEIPVNSPDGTITVSREGSPLNAGVHPIRLHASNSDEGTLVVQKVMMTKMIDHQTTPVYLEQSYEGDEWALIWSDEFDGSGLPDSTKWIYDVGNWGWGNNEPQYYTQARTENARLEDGNLIIEARKNDMGQEWTSARLTTRGKTSFLYGKIEFRAKVPAADGTWAAGWFLGDEYVDELSWPYCGEIDVLETTGKEIDDETGDGMNHASCHTRTYYFKEGTHITSTIEVENMNDEFHTYGIEWTPEGIEAYLDGEYYYTYDKTGDELEWPFDKPQNIILNLAMGGGMGGAIDPSIDSAKLIVDYVRVYGRK